MTCQKCGYDPDEVEREEDDDYDYDEDEVFDRLQERLAECTCGAWQWSKARCEFVHIADCVCGKGL